MGIRHVLGGISALLLAFSGASLYGTDMPGAGTPTVVHGGADFNRAGDNLTVTTQSNRTIINWDRFGVPGGSLTHFAQPGRNSATLNRVNGSIPSRIDGSLTSNGAVFLVNPRGVTVGPNGVVRTDGGFVASTMHLSDRDFINGATGGGTLRFMSPSDGLSGMAANQGLVESVFGDVFFVGTRVDNSGTISAPLGTVGFAAGGNSDVVVQPMGGTGARFEIVPNANSFYGGNGVTNSGVVTAATAELIANGDAYRLAVNNSGLVSARGIDSRPDGSVYLTASGAGGAAGSVVNIGTLRAVDADGSGGAVRMTAGDVQLASGSLVDVSAETADRDGGVALVGGEFQGGKSLSPEEKITALDNAETTVVEAGAVIRADAAGAGSGGLAVVWADGTTTFDGHVSARGGETGGDGGFVEVSGKRDLLFNGTVDTAAPMGRTGTLLLDPADVTIASSGGTITPDALKTALGSSNVVVSTDPAGVGDGNIFVNSNVEWSGAASGNNSLTLLAYNNIIIRANVRNFTPGASNTTSDVNTGDLTLVAGWDGTGWSGSYGLADGNPALPTAPTTLEELQSATWFGNTAGRAAYTVNGNGYQGSIILDAVADSANIGSRNGITALFGYDVALFGGRVLSDSAHIGYAMDWRAGLSTEQIALGDVAVYAKGNLLLTGGYYPYNGDDPDSGSGRAQIGHGGRVSIYSTQDTDVPWHLSANSAPIEVIVSGNITLGGSAHAQIGHGTDTVFWAERDDLIDNWNWGIHAQSASIAVEAGGDITLASGGINAYTQIGHGGDVSFYDYVGDSINNNILNSTWSLIADSSDIRVNAAGKIALVSGDISAYAMIGHGGSANSDATENKIWTLVADSANIEVGAGGNVTLTSGGTPIVGGRYPVKIGHGGLGQEEAVTISGRMNLRANTVNMDGRSIISHSGSDDFAMLINSMGSTGFFFDLGNHTGRTSIVSESALTLTQLGTVSGDLHLIAGWDGVSGWSASTSTSLASFNPEAAIVKSASAGSAINNLVISAPIVITGSLDARAADNVSVNRNLTIGGFGSIRSGQDLTIASTANILGNANDTALLLTAGGKFLNQSSADALTVSASGAKWLVWTADPTGSRHGGLLNPRQFAYATAPTVNFADMTPNFLDTVSLSGSGFLLPGAAPTFTITVDDATPRYYGDANTLDWGYTLSSASGLILGDTLDSVKSSLVDGTLVRDTNAGQFSNAGGAYYTNITNGLTSNLGYTLDSANNTKGALTVTRRPITVTADDKSRVYGDTNPVLTWGVTSGNLVNGDTISGTLATVATMPSNVDNYAITQGALSAGSNYDITFVNGTLTVTARPITVTADDKSRIYGDTNPLLTWGVTSGNLVNGDTLSGDLATIATTASNVGDYAITKGTLAASPNYNMTFVDGALTVTRRPITVTADDKSRIYGDANPLLTWGVTSGNLVNGDTLSGNLATTATVTSNVGDYAITKGAWAANPNYDITFVGGTLTVTARPITVTADDKSRIYGDANPTLTWGVTSGNLVNGDTLSGGLATIATTASNVGDYAITKGTLAASPNYSMTFVDGTLTVTARPITVTADDASRIYGNTNPPLGWEVTSGNFVNGDTLSGALATAAAVTSNVGSYAITKGTLAASSNYDMNFVDGTLTVTARPITVTADNKNRIYGDSNPSLTWGVTSGNLVNGDTLSGALATTATVTSNVGDYAITKGTLAASSNYNMTLVDGTLTVTPRPITVTADNKSRIYGDSNPSLIWGVTSGNLVNGDTLSGALTTAAAATSNVGSYAITQGALSAGSNYAMTFMNGALTVTPAMLTVAANTYTREYGDANISGLAGYTVSGWKGSDSAGNVTLTGGLSALSGQFADAGIYADAVIGSFTASSVNYTVDFVPGDMVITPAELTVTANPYTREYGDLDGVNLANYVVDASNYKRADDVATAVVSGNVVVNAGIGRFADVSDEEKPYNNAIDIGTLTVSDPNYRINFVSNQMVITPAPLLVSAKPFEREYGGTNLPDLLTDFNTWGWKREEDKTQDVTGTAGLTIYPWDDVGTYDNAVTKNTLDVKNYAIDFRSNSVRITPAPLFVTADDLSKQYNTVNPPLTWSATGFKEWDDGESLHEAGALGTDAMMDSTPGGYAIYQTTPFSFGKNYNVTFQEGMLTVVAHTETERPDAGDNIVDYTPLLPEIPENQTPGSDGENFEVQPPSGDDFSGLDDGEANLPEGHHPGNGDNGGGNDDGEQVGESQGEDAGEDEQNDGAQEGGEQAEGDQDDNSQEGEDGDTENGDADDDESEESGEPDPEPEVPADMLGNGYPAVQGDVNRDGVVDVQDANNASNGDLGYGSYITQNMTYDSPVFWWDISQDEKVEYLKQHGNEMYNPEDDIKFKELPQRFENWLNQGNNRELYEQHGAEIEAWNASKNIYEKWTDTGGF